MHYIPDEHYEYIMAKNGERYGRKDDYFDPATGMEPTAVLTGIRAQDAEIRHEPHPVRKAKALAYVLANTRIECDARDPYPAINMIDRPLNATLIAEWRAEVFRDQIRDIEQERSLLEDRGVVTMWIDYDHSVPDWDVIFRSGFVGILEANARARAEHPAPTEQTEAFYEGIRITYEAVIAFLGRLEARARAKGACRLAEALKHLQIGAPATFYEALLIDYLYFIICEHIEGLQARSLSHFDRLLTPFFENDLARGVTEEEIRTALAYFFLQFTSIGNYFGQPVFLGGCTEDEGTQIGALSYLFLDVYDKMGIYNPKVQIKVAQSTPKPFLLKALDMIRRGNSSIVFVNDETVRTALMRAGSSAEDARLCNIKGCYEYSVNGGIDIGMNYVNLIKPIEFVLHGGRDGITGEPLGLACGDADSAFPTFDDFFAEYKRQLGNVTDTVIRIVNVFEDHLAQINPQSLLSATFPSCFAQGRDALAGGGIENGSTMMFGCMADAADSLANIKKYVYDKKLLTLSQLRDMLDADFEGNEKLRRILLADPDKFGNNRDLPDTIAREIAAFVCEKVVGRPNAALRHGQWTAGFHVARMSYIWGDLSASSANGRLRGEELSKNLSASMGMNREGATAAILSTTKIDARTFASDGCLDLGLLPSAVKGEDGLIAMYGLLMTYLKRHGQALHINVFNADTLRQAQKEPEKYKDLQIRVSGWNVLFNNINKVEQDGFIKQAEGLI